ncbi:translation initiation factor IF-3 [Paenibacillus xerothermodurans]|uniref:Translation initiation factor IF-3 n=1 Tax=Paenibacillus xerothermodurans TaxID=1977292 RepID=A0A2W1NW63_PAEXE|nr:translation initiation factor IF-3 [Paenibacillus xerothermodurans]PZE22783.1 translation initiation factor IF-3 [Paenibacillus xerothermodurans]
MLLINEKIKAAEVHLTGLQEEDLGVVARDEALALAKRMKADLVCTSLMSSPPPCKLVARGTASQTLLQEKRKAKKEAPAKEKEIRLSANIEDHDYGTKKSQAEKSLAAGHSVRLVVRLQAKEGQKAKELLERMLRDLSGCGREESGIQLSGKQAVVKVNPLR